MKIKNVMILFVAFFAAIAGAYIWGRCTCRYPPPKTIVQTDTVRVVNVIHDTVKLVTVIERTRVDTMYVKTSAEAPDSVPVEVPIEQRIYQTENYRVVVEGWHPMLKDVEVYPKTEYIYTTKTIQKRERIGWGIGLQVGYGFTPKGRQPYAGIGISYTYSF